MSLAQKPATRFLVDDNSGAKEVGFVGYLGNSKIRHLKVGDIIKVSVKKALPNNAIKPGQMFFAIVTVLRKPTLRKDGSKVVANHNGVVLLNNTKEAMVGTRVLAAVSREVEGKYPAIAKAATGVF